MWSKVTVEDYIRQERDSLAGRCGGFINGGAVALTRRGEAG